ncbi:MAG: hypothetical protein GQ536_02145 [Candidatus Aminicenantes bacterium]|nr:hypothetical protein [Candidatus Aminicenantes bacterium]
MEKALGDSLAPLQIFNAILYSLFSAASKLRITTHDTFRIVSFLNVAYIFFLSRAQTSRPADFVDFPRSPNFKG